MARSRSGRVVEHDAPVTTVGSPRPRNSRAACDDGVMMDPMKLTPMMEMVRQYSTRMMRQAGFTQHPRRR